ncbi:MAG: hypothetical protein ABI824_10395 [Acidobacteriota bacterium]
MTVSSGAAKMKCLDPITSIGPPTSVTVLEIDDRQVTIKVDRPYIPRTGVQVLFDHQVILGTITASTLTDDGHTIQVARTTL